MTPEIIYFSGRAPEQTSDSSYIVTPEYIWAFNKTFICLTRCRTNCRVAAIQPASFESVFNGIDWSDLSETRWINDEPAPDEETTAIEIYSDGRLVAQNLPDSEFRKNPTAMLIFSQIRELTLKSEFKPCDGDRQAFNSFNPENSGHRFFSNYERLSKTGLSHSALYDYFQQSFTSGSSFEWACSLHPAASPAGLEPCNP